LGDGADVAWRGISEASLGPLKARVTSVEQ